MERPRGLSHAFEENAAFIRAHTELRAVPLVTGVRLFTATEVVPMWRATETWLADKGIGIPFWCVPWAGGQALARWILDHPETVQGKRVVDFGAGSGLVGIVAAKAGAAHVLAVDVDPMATAACILNAKENDVALETACTDLVGSELATDVVLAGDVWYELGPSARFASWFGSLSDKGIRVFTGDPGRHYVPANAHARATYEVPTPWELESAHSRTARVLEVLPLPR